jgi:hypothetical protein
MCVSHVSISNFQDVAALVSTWITVNDQSCTGNADNGLVPQKLKTKHLSECLIYGDTRGPALAMYSVFMTPVGGANITVGLYSDGNCQDYIGSYGPLDSEGACIFSRDTPDCFRGYVLWDNS